MKNRWSDAARLAALAVRKARAFAADPVKGNAAPQQGGLAPKPVAALPSGGGDIPPPGRKSYSADAKGVPQPNIFYSSKGPKGPLDRQVPQAVIRYGGAAPKGGTQSMPPKTGGGADKTKRTDGMRYIIGGMRYTRVGNKLTPDETPAGGKVKNFYLRG